MAFDPKAWIRDPSPFVAEALGGAHYAALGVPHVPSAEQTAYALDVARTLTRSVDRPGIVSMPEAETGIGKTRGYLLPALLHAVATGGRVVLATYRIDLRAALVDREAPAALGVVERMTGRKLRLAPLMARTHFASPSRARAFADRISAEAPAAAAALRSVATWTEICARGIATSPRSAISSLASTIELWEREHPEFADHLPKADLDQWRLDSQCSSEEHLAWETYREFAHEADCLVMTQAALILALRIGSGFGDGPPVVGVVVDEADRLEDAARSILERRGSIADLERSRFAIHAALARDDIPLDGKARGAILDIAFDIAEQIKPLHEFCTEIRERRSRERNHETLKGPVSVLGNEPWLSHLSTVSASVVRAAGALRATGVPALASVADDIAARAAIHSEFVKCALDPDKVVGRTYLTFSPVHGFPSVLVSAKFGSRIVQRLWNGTKADGSPIARATVFTSATLAQPGLSGPARLEGMAKMIGLHWSPDRLQDDLSGHHAPTKFGTVERFVLAHPDAPLPPMLNDEEGEREVDEAAYWRHRAECIARAADAEPVAGRRRVLVLTTGFRDTEGMASFLPDRLSNRLIVRRTGQSMAEVLDLFRAAEDAILITPGAMEGVDLPGLIGRLLIPRLPFAPPDDAFGKPFVWQTDAGLKASSSVERMMRRLKQAIGRAIRKSTDVAEIWILDPRFGLPELVQRRHMLQSAASARGLYQLCVPARFRPVLDNAEIIETEAVAAPRRRRAAGGRK